MNVLACAFCLSSDRNLFFMEERRFHLIYSMLDVDYGQYMKYLQSAGGLRACWCCQARVRSIQRFASSARRSLDALREHLAAATQVPLPSQTTLCITEVEVLDIPPLPLKPEPQSSQLAAKDEPQTDGLVFELLPLSTQGIKSEDDSVDNEDYDNCSDVDYLPEPEDIKTLKGDIKVEEKSLDGNFSDADNREDLIKQESLLIEQEVLGTIPATKVKKKQKTKIPTAPSTKSKKEIETKIKKEVKKSPKTAQSPNRWSHGWATTELATRWYKDERASETELCKAKRASETDGYCVCVHCGRDTFATAEELMQHFNSKHDEAVGALECDLCKYRFDSKETLTKHLEEHFKLYRCKLCPHITRSRKLIQRHCRETHRGEKGARSQSNTFCMRCKVKFDTPALLRAHRVACSTYKCTKCDKCFGDKGTFYQHIVTHSVELKKTKDKLYCEVCDKEFISRIWFKKHFRTSLKHVSRDTFRHECPHCKLRFHAAQLLREHVAAKHMHRGLYACDLCNKSFTVNASLRKHRARQHGIGSVPAPPRDKICDHCGKGFTSNQLLNNHVRSHTGERPFQCPLCPAKFAQNGSLYVHTRSMHQRRLGKDGTSDCDAQYGCPECGKPFWSRGQLRAHHKLYHLKESNFNCHVCNKMFPSSGHLKDHVASRHGVLYSESYRCDTCGKIFNTPSALKIHEKTHSSTISLHQCRACEAAFKNPGQLYMHFKLKHLKLKRSDKVSIKNISNPEKQLFVNGKPQ